MKIDLYELIEEVRKGERRAIKNKIRIALEHERDRGIDTEGKHYSSQVHNGYIMGIQSVLRGL